MSENEKENQISASTLVNQLRNGKVLHDQFADEFRKRYKIAGKLINEWKDHFKITMPPDLDPVKIQLVDVLLMELHQEATFLKAEVEARLTACRSRNDDMYRTEYARLVTEYKSKQQKLPAKDTLAALAEEKTGDIKNALTHAEIELCFWKEILNDLRNSRRLIDNATINISVEAKALNHEKYITALNSQRNY